MSIPEIRVGGSGTGRISMSGKLFVDTNIFLYAHDRADPIKQARAREVIRAANGPVVVSTQVMQEFFVGATRKLQVPAQAVKRVLQAWQPFEIVQITPERVFEAIDIQILNHISFWDALIVAAAAAAECPVLLTEDLNDGQVISGVRLENPFKRKAESEGKS